MTHHDLHVAFILLALLAIISLAYLFWIFFKGRARNERVDHQGGSPLLSKRILEMGYWILQPLARLAVTCKLSPNAISYTALGLGAVTGYFLAGGHIGYAAASGMICGLFDALDGMVARQSGTISPAGKVLDSALDRYVEFFFFLGLLVFYKSSLPLQFLVMVSLLGSFMVSYSTALAEITQVHLPRGSMQRPERMAYLILGAMISPLSFFYLEQSNRFLEGSTCPMIFSLILIATIGNASAAMRIRNIRRSIQERETRAIELTLAQVRKAHISRFNTG